MLKVIYIILLCILSLGLYGFTSYKDLTGISDKELLFLLDFKGYTEYEHLMLYELQPNKFYIPLMDYITAIHFNITEDKNHILSGTFYNKTNKIVVNPMESTIKVNDKNILFKDNDIYVIEGQIYVTIPLLEQIFDLRINPDIRNLILSTFSNQLLPIEYYDIKERNRKYLQTLNQQQSEDFYINNNLFNLPTADFYTNFHYLENTKTNNSHLNNSTTVSLGAVILGLDANTSVSRAAFGNEDRTRTNVVFSKTYIKQPFGINYLQFGDIYTPQSSLLSNNTSGRGLYVSSSKNYEINQNKTVVLEGILLPGWEVELYKNGQLLDYQKESFSGRYKFQDIPVDVGNNNFKLLFYSPYGEIKEEIKNILVGATPVEKGQVGFTLTALQPHRKVIENSNEYSFYKGDTAVHSELDTFYGVTDNFALSAGYSLQEDPEYNSHYNSFYSLGSIYSIYNFSTELNVAANDNSSKLAYQGSIQGNTKLGSIYTNYEDYNGTHPQKSYTNFQYAANFSEIRYGNYLKLFQTTIPFYVGYTNTNYDPLSTSYTYRYDKHMYLRTQYTFLSKYFATVEAIRDSNDIYSRELINTLLSTNYKAISFRGNIEYSYYPQSMFDNVGLTIDYRPPNIPYYFYIQYNHYYNSLPIDEDYWETGVSWVTRPGNFNASIASNGSNIYNFSLAYNVSLGYNQINQSLYIASDTSLINSGNVEIKIFEDLNNNNHFDPNIDQPISDAMVKLDGITRPNLSDANGTLNINSLNTYLPITVSINTDSIKNIMLEPKVIDRRIILKPGVLEPILFSLVTTGDIEGVIYKNDGTLFQYAKIELYDTQGILVRQTQADRDALFILERIPYGSGYYMIITDTETQATIKKENITIDSGTTYIK